MMAETQAIRVVPSGKIYRQIFDSQVQLANVLEKTSEERTKKGVKIVERPGGIPVVKEKRHITEGTGILSQRQKTWIEGFPNDYSTENPVLYKQVTEFTNQKLAEPESSVVGREVRGLPDIVVAAKPGSDIIQRIADSRRERHERALEDMHQELGVITADLEPSIIEAGEKLMSMLKENDQEIDLLMSRIESDENLLTLTLIELHEIWDAIQSQTSLRRGGIEELDSTLSEVEDDRMERIRKVFSEYAETLEKISHLMAPDLSRLMDMESQAINQSVLSNRRSYADLYGRLMTTDIEREKKQHTLWTRRVQDWRTLNIQQANEKFQNFMSSEAVVRPQGAQKVLELMKTEQGSLNERRLRLISSLKELKPPASTKTAVYHWNEKVVALSEQIDALNQGYLERLHSEYEEVCQLCLEEVEKARKKLISSGVCSEQKATEVIEESFLPLVGDRQKIFEQELEDMDKQLEEHNDMLMIHLKSLFKFAQGAAHVWDVHEIGLAKQERSLQEKLESCRHQHDNQNQEKEGNLDIIMDRMRQDATETALKESLKKAMDMLDKIRNGYESFHEEQMAVVRFYPEMVKDELDNYDHTVCKFFSVDRRHPDDVEAKDEEETTKSKEGLTPRSKGKSRRKSKKSDRPGSRTSEGDKSPLPMAVSEILSTARGTAFFVLTVAGEFSGHPDDPRSSVEPPGSTFLTESVLPKVLPPYLASVDVSEEFLAEVKKGIRMNFLDHLEEWSEEAMERSRSVVAAKIEELNSELDLRLHLHQPRTRRAELDVHNVRAAELVMHSERVTRHCKGINHSLTELKQQFAKMTHEHDKLASKFREGIEALEVVFINATKSAKLVALQNRLQEELDKFMSVIRASLRQFRQHLDDTLAMLRQSNAKFIKSFKLFSDGGNFCPEEIDEYRKKLEKMSQKIDAAEGFIMADLEGMESKRLDQATKVASEFEDRFKNHMFDLIFMEKIARWLTNTQVKIKAEVADSNTQAQRLAQFLNDLDRRIDACEKPNLDKEQVSPTQLNNSLKAIFEAFHSRSQYLNSLKDPNTIRPQSATMQGAPALGARVGFAVDTGVPAISKAGKQPAEDPSISTIKNILKTQKTKLRFGPDADLDGEVTAEKERQTKSMSRPPTQGTAIMEAKSVGTKHSRKGTATTATSDPTRRSQSAPFDIWTVVKAKTKLTSLVNLSPVTEHRGSSRGSHSRASSVRRSTYGSNKMKIDKRFLIFGEKDEEGEESHFLGKIRHTLREALDGLLTTAELYYRQKGSRPVTRPQALQETFEQCAEIVVQKLESYYKQADEYHNQCLQEFRSQLTHLEQLIARVPPLVINEIAKTHIQKAHQVRKEIDEAFQQQLEKWNSKKYEHKNLLRPTLGHPHQHHQMKSLCDEEESRRTDYIQGVQGHHSKQQQSSVEHAEEFIAQLASASEQLLLQFDNLLTVDDVEKGRVDPKKYPTSELIRRRAAGVPLEDEEDKNALPRGKGTWQGIVKNELVCGDKPDKPKLTASVNTAKTTLGHSAAVTARDQAYQDYKKQFEKTLHSIEEQKLTWLNEEQRWTDSWQSSVEKVVQLYKT